MPKHTLGDAPVQPEFVAKMTAIMETLDEFVNGDKRPKEVGIVILMFKYGEAEGTDRCNFMSNGANREDIVSLFKEMIARFEGQPQQSGRA